MQAFFNESLISNWLHLHSLKPAVYLLNVASKLVNNPQALSHLSASPLMDALVNKIWFCLALQVNHPKKWAYSNIQFCNLGPALHDLSFAAVRRGLIPSASMPLDSYAE